MIESTLGLRHGLFGCLADGWEVADLELGVRRDVPDDALLARCLAGVLARDAMGPEPMSVEEFNWAATANAAATRPGFRMPQIPAELLDQFRTALAVLRRRWGGLPSGGTLELTFEA
ncbi:MAG: hypothetical protein ACHQXA_08400 [Gemmatimonadales bacterium]